MLARSFAAVASRLHGSVGEFDPSSETFTSYLERLDQFFVANDIANCAAGATAAVVQEADKKKVAVMISVIGQRSYGTLRDFCIPENPKGKLFEALCELLQEHLKPKRLDVAESYRFYQCCQEENEIVSVYSARLRHLAFACNFGEFLNQFVCGICNPPTRKKLLSQDRTFQEALQVAIADEIAAKETLQVQQQRLSQSVNSVSKETSSCGISTSRPSPNQTSPKFQPVSSYACFSCGNSDYERSKCKFRNAVCRHCKLRGHIA